MVKHVISIKLGALLMVMLVPFASDEARAQGQHPTFYLDELPEGSSVILPQPITTYMGMHHRLQIKATDTPQTIKLQSVRTDRRAAKKIRVAVHDRQAKKVTYIEVSPDNPYLYTFRGLSTIALVPDVSEQDLEDATLRIAIDSNKPIELIR